MLIYEHTLIVLCRHSLKSPFVCCPGHGPFSHMFDGMFIPKVRPGEKWKVSVEKRH